MTEIKKLIDKMLKCEACDLACTRTQVVPGDGDPSAPVFFIGEAPGKKEDETGIPFRGAAGKFLNEMITENNFTRESDDLKKPNLSRGLGSAKIPSKSKKTRIFITNIVKCRPPENRDPSELEKKTCSKKWLDKQIKLSNPKIIVTLGRHAMNHFLPDVRIGDAHGKVFHLKNGQIIIPLYHPSAALYRASQRDVHKKDFKIIRRTLKKIEE